jgi:HEAT repeat protein
VLLAAVIGTVAGALLGGLFILGMLALVLLSHGHGDHFQLHDLFLGALTGGLAGLGFSVILGALPRRDHPEPTRRKTSRTWRRWLVRSGVVVLGTAALFFGLTSIGWSIVGGLLRHEPFYDCLPRSYWLDATQSNDPKRRSRAVSACKEFGSEHSETVVALGQLALDPDPMIATSAAYGLQELKQGARPAVKGLTLALRSHPNADVRRKVAEALKEIGPGAAAAVPDLQKALDNDPDPPVRAEVVSALRRIGPAAAAALPSLIDLLPEKQRAANYSGTTWELLAAIVAMGQPAVEPLHDLLKSKDDKHQPALSQQMRRNIIGALAEIGPPAVEALIEALHTPDLHEQAADALSKIGAPAVPALCEVLTKDRSAEVRSEAAETLGRIGPAAASAVDPLTKALSDPEVAVNVAYALGAIGPAAAPATRALIDALRSTAEKRPRGATKSLEPIHVAAAWALGDIGPGAADALPALRQLLTEGSHLERLRAAQAICRIAPQEVHAGQVGPVFVAALANRDIVRKAARTLAELTPECRALVPVDVWVRTLSSEPEQTRRDAAKALGERKETMAAITALVEHAHDEDFQARIEVVKALGKLAERDATAIEPLAAALDDKHPDVVVKAAEALGALGPRAKAGVPALEKARQARQGWVRGPVVLALWKTTGDEGAFHGALDNLNDSNQGTVLEKLAPVGEPALPVLLDALKRNDLSFLCGTMAEYAGNLGPAAAAAVPDLLRLRKDHYGSDRKRIDAALEKIQPGILQRSVLKEDLVACGQIGGVLAGVALFLAGLCWLLFGERGWRRPITRPVFPEDDKWPQEPPTS